MEEIKYIKITSEKSFQLEAINMETGTSLVFGKQVLEKEKKEENEPPEIIQHYIMTLQSKYINEKLPKQGKEITWEEFDKLSKEITEIIHKKAVESTGHE